MKVPAVPPAVNRPPAVMPPPPLMIDQTGVMATGLPYWSDPAAVNRSVPLMFRVAGLGVTVTVARGPVVTMTVA